MKKVLLFAVAFVAVAMVSCDKECECTYTSGDFSYTQTTDLSGTGTSCSKFEDELNDLDSGWVCN